MQTINLLTQCLAWAKRWRTPPHWSPDDWQEELLATAWAALWEGLSKGIRDEAELRRFIMAALMRRYRDEWNYGVRWVTPNGDSSEDGDGESDLESWEYYAAIGAEDESDTVWVALVIRQALSRLSEEERYLIERKFWDGATERELARELGISQPAVHKRLCRILERLRHLLEPLR
ncbi:hypothetical protein HRbin17_00535 [bacterium HR17]|jgi:RNA polymerase sigma factor (sigma-70 family)|uniref:RNA polymerase sigma factor 70 region 4 type 2 domain-containing protein n=1 Tax=Candidatus Fervidibacter japonicus TaxID=2035412 RepID=A0A2H5XA23_9BACT|nr:hypothetical protein HRbin17_00535 [bacterium HR17]